VLSYGYLENREGRKEEYYLLLLLATLGSSVLAASTHFASFFLGLEVLSVSLYALVSYQRTNENAIEAGIKYLVLAATSSAILLFGMALIYSQVGTMEFAFIASRLATYQVNQVVLLAGFALVISGIGFKLAVVPFHMWTPDVYQGASAPISGFIASVSKGGMFALLFRLFIEFNIYRHHTLMLIFTVIAIASMFGGNLLALLQQNVKRILAYSSIAHLGYLLVAFLAGGNTGVEAATFYWVTYFITIIAAFGIVTILSTGEREAESIEDYRGLMWERPWLTFVFTVVLLSLSSIPLTAGFIGKFYVIAAGIKSSLWALVLIIVVNSAIGLYYYLRIIVVMYSPPAGEENAASSLLPSNSSISLSGSFTLAALTVFLIWFGVYPTGILAMIKVMVATLTYSVLPAHVGLF